MRKVTNEQLIEYVDEYIQTAAPLIIKHELKIKKLSRLLFMSLLGFTALGTYLVVKSNK